MFKATVSSRERGRQYKVLTVCCPAKVHNPVLTVILDRSTGTVHDLSELHLRDTKQISVRFGVDREFLRCHNLKVADSIATICTPFSTSMSRALLYRSAKLGMNDYQLLFRQLNVKQT